MKEIFIMEGNGPTGGPESTEGTPNSSPYLRSSSEIATQIAEGTEKSPWLDRKTEVESHEPKMMGGGAQDNDQEPKAPEFPKVSVDDSADYLKSVAEAAAAKRQAGFTQQARQTVGLPAEADPLQAAVAEAVINEEPQVDNQAGAAEPGNGDIEMIDVIREGGIKQPVEVPRSAEGKMKMLADLLEGLEATKLENGGDVISHELALMRDLIATLRGRDRETSNLMNAEFMARVDFHRKYLDFFNSGSMSALKDVYSKLSSTTINAINHKEEVLACSNYYEHFGQDYKNNPELFTNRLIASYLLANQIAPDGATRFVGDRAFQNQYSANIDALATRIKAGEFADEAKKVKWAQNLSQRWWEMKGSRTSADELKDDNTGFKDAEVQRDGLYELRNLFKWKEILKTRENAWHPKFHLFGMKKRNNDILADNYADIDLRINNYDQEVASKLKDLGVTVDYQGKPIVDENGKVNYLARVGQNGEKLFFKDFNYETIGERPMGFWSYRKLGQPNDAKDALAKDGEAYSSKPSIEKLYAAFPKLAYFGDDVWAVQETLLSNFLKWSKYERRSDTDRPNMTKEEVEGLLLQAAGLDPEKEIEYVRVEEMQKIENDVLRNFNQPSIMNKTIEKVNRLRGIDDRSEAEKLTGQAKGRIRRRNTRRIALTFLGGFVTKAWEAFIKAIFKG